jgi:hypothetical protein
VGKGTVTALRAAGEQRTSAPAAQPLSKCVWMEILDSRRVDHPWSGSQTANTPSRLWGVVSCTLRGDAEEEPIWTPGSPVRSRKAMHTHRFGTRTPARLLLAPLLSNRAAGKGGASLPTVWTRCPSDGRVRPPCGCRTEVVSIRCLPCGKQRQGWTVGSARTSSPTLFIGKHCFMSGWLSMSVRASDTDVTVRPYL